MPNTLWFSGTPNSVKTARTSGTSHVSESWLIHTVPSPMECAARKIFSSAQALSQEVIPVSPISSFDGMISAAGLYMSYFSLPSALPTAAVSFAIFSRFKTAEKCQSNNRSKYTPRASRNLNKRMIMYEQ